jgi:hypothetical protein
MSKGKSTSALDHRTAIIVAAITAGIGAIATITAALVGHAQGASDASPGQTVTTTVTARPSATVTVISPAGGSGGGQISPAVAAGCGTYPGCKGQDLSVPMGTGGNETSIDFSLGKVQFEGISDLQFMASSDGTPEIVSPGTAGSATYSLDVTASNASFQQCKTATNSDPQEAPITNLHKGLYFCVLANDGIALAEETEPLGSNNVLHLHDVYWPISNS